MIRVSTGSRLHFGLFNLSGDQTERRPTPHGSCMLPARRFGGVGLMIEAPGIQLRVSRATAWSAEGSLAERALQFARRFAESVPEVTPCCHIQIDGAAPEHAGLGTGTQLGLAVARALTAAGGHPEVGATELAKRVGRGARSAVGSHGFAEGGFLVEAGQRTPDTIAPLVSRLTFPSGWRVLLVLPRSPSGLYGGLERQAFAQLPLMPDSWTDALCRLVLLGILPALQEADVEAFGEAIHEFNVRVGEAFAPVQGGTYAEAAVADVVRFLRSRGARGVGQSSWGPTVFAMLGDEDQAESLAGQVREQFGLARGDVLMTRGRNTGAVCLEQ